MPSRSSANVIESRDEKGVREDLLGSVFVSTIIGMMRVVRPIEGCT